MSKMKKFTIEVEEVKRHLIEVDASNADEAANLARKLFAGYIGYYGGYEYTSDVIFDDTKEVVAE